MKRHLSLVFTAFFILGSFLINVAAQEPIETQDAIYAYVVWDGQIYPLTQDEAELFKANPEEFAFYNDNNLEPSMMMRAQRGYYQASYISGTFIDTSKRTYVSSCFAGGPYGGTMSVTQSASVSASFTKGASLSATYKSMIAASISSSATLSVSTNASQTGTYTVPANKFGRVAFSPRVLQTTGNFIVEEDRVGGTVVEISRTPVDANFPLKLSNGLADGLYEPIYGNVAF